MGLLQTGLRVRQLTGEIPTICMRCKVSETSCFYDDGSYTKRCKCGTTTYTFHKEDEFNKFPIYQRVFIPRNLEIKDYKKKNVLERNGFKNVNGKFVR